MKEKQHVHLHVLLCLYMLMRDEEGRKKEGSMYMYMSCTVPSHVAIILHVICSVATAPVLISDITPGLGISIQLVYTCTCIYICWAGLAMAGQGGPYSGTMWFVILPLHWRTNVCIVR